MPLISIKRLAYERSYSYAPPVEETLLHTNDIVAVVATEARGSGPFVRITLRGHDAVVALGTPEGLLAVIAQLEGALDGVGVLHYPAAEPGAREDTEKMARLIRKGVTLILPNTRDDAGGRAWDFRIVGGDPGQVIVKHEDAPQPDVVAGEQS